MCRRTGANRSCSNLTWNYFDSDGLTDRQRDVVELVLQHQSSKEIARRLGISHHTVDQRVAAARKKFNAGSRAELARIYGQHRMICEEPLYQFPQVAEPSVVGHEGQRDQPVEPVFTLSDVAHFQMTPPWQGASAKHAGLEAFDNRFGITGRLASIVALSTLMAVMLLAVVAIMDMLSRSN